MSLNKKKYYKKLSIGFIGVGIMGEGMVCNLIDAGFRLYVKKHNNPDPIERVKKKGAIELNNIIDIIKKCNVIILCLPNSAIVKETINKFRNIHQKKHLIIDCTTNDYESVLYLTKLANIKNFNYVEAPIAGGSLQAKNGELGAFIGSNKKHFQITKKILKPCCKKIMRIGKIGMGTKAKLVSNFLALGTASLVIESLRISQKLKIDWKKFYQLSSLGSGSSKSLDRIAQRAIHNDFESYVFTIKNTIKDFRYMLKLFKDEKSLKKITKSLLNTYLNDQKKYSSNALISHRLKK